MRLVFASIEHDEIFNVHITHNIINRRKYSFNFSLRVTFSAIFLAIIFPNIFFLFFFSLSLVLIFYNNFRFEETDRESVVVVKILKKNCEISELFPRYNRVRSFDVAIF